MSVSVAVSVDLSPSIAMRMEKLQALFPVEVSHLVSKALEHWSDLQLSYPDDREYLIASMTDGLDTLNYQEHLNVGNFLVDATTHIHDELDKFLGPLLEEARSEDQLRLIRFRNKTAVIELSKDEV